MFIFFKECKWILNYKYNYHENGIVHQALMMTRITASGPAFLACGLGRNAEPFPPHPGPVILQKEQSNLIVLKGTWKPTMHLTK